jgi:molybdopterin molybdotransferase
MISVEQAESLILDLAQPLRETESLGLLEAGDRILARSVIGQLDVPYWDNSAMDGYTVRYQDVAQASAESPAVLEIVEEIPAGTQPKQVIQPGQAARIFTGGMMPKGADTVVMQENTDHQGSRVSILVAPERSQSFVRQQGDYYKAGESLLPIGIRLSAPEIAVLATVQCSKVEVYRRLRVAIFSTGDELVSPDQPLGAGQIVDSNQYAIAAFIAQQGAIPIPMGIIPDDPARLQTAMQTAIAQADLVISTGGVSVGDYDYVEKILETLGGKIAIRSVAIKPGKPLTVASFLPDVLYFGIPGNPVSALVSCWRFVLPALNKRSGLAQGWQPTVLSAYSEKELRSDGKRETYLWGRLTVIDGQYRFDLAGGSHSSANLINLAQTNALAIVPVGQSAIAAGEPVQVMVTGRL